MSICCIKSCKTKQKKLSNSPSGLNIPKDLMNDSRKICNNHYRYYLYLGKTCELCSDKVFIINNKKYMCQKHYKIYKYKNKHCSIKGCKHKIVGDKIDGEYYCHSHKIKIKYRNTECSIHGCHNKHARYKKLYIATDPIKKENSGVMCPTHNNRYKLGIIRYLKKKLDE